jgi:hypothetical protein
MNAEIFRVDFFRWQFLVLFAAVAIWVGIDSLPTGLFAAVMALWRVALVVAIAWFFGTVQVGPEGVVLYRVHKLKWAEVTKVESATVLGLPHLRVFLSTGMTWFVPLYVRGSRSIEESLRSWAPSGNLLDGARTQDQSSSNAT